MQFHTRDNNGQVHDHFTDLEEALSYFLSPDGYRLDFSFPDGSVLYIHRAEFGENIPEEKANHPSWSNYLLANAGVMYHNPHLSSEDIKNKNNVVQLFSKRSDS